MTRNKQIKHSLLASIGIPASIIFLQFIFFMEPTRLIEAASLGVKTWLNHMIPAILPFAFGVHLLLELGVTEALGSLLEPLMKVFRLPGRASFPIIMGILAGYPLGAEMTASMREKNQLTTKEASILSTFTNHAGPLYMIGAVGVSLYKTPLIGYLFFLAHVAASLTTGLLFTRFLPPIPERKRLSMPQQFRQAFQQMQAYRAKNPKNFGEILSFTMEKTMKTMLYVGGFIIVAQVVSEALILTGIIPRIAKFLPFTAGESIGFLAGLIEITGGLLKISIHGLTHNALLLSSFLLGFGGLCVHAQSIGFLAKTDISLSTYFLGKIVHGALSVFFVCLFFPIFKNNLQVVPAFAFMELSFMTQLFMSSKRAFLSMLIIFLVTLAFPLLQLLYLALKPQKN